MLISALASAARLLRPRRPPTLLAPRCRKHPLSTSCPRIQPVTINHMNLTTGASADQILSLDNIRSQLIRLEDTIIFCECGRRAPSAERSEVRGARREGLASRCRSLLSSRRLCGLHLWSRTWWSRDDAPGRERAKRQRHELSRGKVESISASLTQPHRPHRPHRPAAGET